MEILYLYCYSCKYIFKNKKCLPIDLIVNFVKPYFFKIWITIFFIIEQYFLSFDPGMPVGITDFNIKLTINEKYLSINIYLYFSQYSYMKKTYRKIFRQQSCSRTTLHTDTLKNI